MDISSLNTIKKSPLFNILMFSGFWALQLFVTKLAVNSGAQVLSFQLLSIGVALALLAITLLPRFGGDFRSLYITSMINAGFLVKLATVTTILFAWLILKERLTATKVMMVISMLSGAYLLTTKGQILLPRVGDLYILGACVSWSLGNVLVRKHVKSQPIKIELVTFQKPLAGLPVVLVLVSLAVWSPDIFGSLSQTLSCCKPPLAVLPHTVGNGFLLAMTWTYLNNTLKISSASYMTMMSMITPVIVSLLAIIFLGETLIWIQILGAGLIILSGVVTHFSSIANE